MPSADCGGSRSVRGRICSPHSSGGLVQLGAACLAGPGGTDRRTDRQTDGRIAASLNAHYGAGEHSK